MLSQLNFIQRLLQAAVSPSSPAPDPPPQKKQVAGKTFIREKRGAGPWLKLYVGTLLLMDRWWGRERTRDRAGETHRKKRE